MLLFYGRPRWEKAGNDGLIEREKKNVLAYVYCRSMCVGERERETKALRVMAPNPIIELLTGVDP